MDITRFIPCLIKTATNSLRRAKAYYAGEVKGEGVYQHHHVTLYGTTVDIIREDSYDFKGNIDGIRLNFFFPMGDYEISFYLTTADDPSSIKERIFRAVNARLIETRKFVDQAEEFRNELLPEIEE